VAGTDRFEIQFITNLSDHIRAFTEVPHLEVSLPGEVHIGCEPVGNHVVRLRREDGALRGVARFHAPEECWGSTRHFKRDGERVRIKRGNRIVSDLAADARLVWPIMAVDAAGMQVAGRCFPNARMVVFITRGPSGTTAPGATTSDGTFSIATSWTFAAGDRLYLVCETPRGDQARFEAEAS
jgi:hypothetical protein